MKQFHHKLLIKTGSDSLESRDWCRILARMYMLWFKNRGVEYENIVHDGEIDNEYVIQFNANNEARICLRTEIGIHRLVRVSPFDPENRRHTSFASVSLDDYDEDAMVRSYVFEPYQSVRDHLTKIEVTVVQPTLDGNIDLFINGRLKVVTPVSEIVILDEINEERKRQHRLAHGGDTDKFDEQNTQNDWIAYIATYSGRAAQKIEKNERDGEDFRKNMIKVAALALAAISAYDKGWCNGTDEPTS